MLTSPPRLEEVNIIPPSPPTDSSPARVEAPPSAGEDLRRLKRDHPSDGSETETEMPDRKSDKHRDGGKASSSKPRSYSGSKPGAKQLKDDWSDVVEPDERRRIQNRIAQRKFREKAKEKREMEERDAENQQRAGLAYARPRPGDIVADSDLSGLPWGGVSMRHILSRGQTRETESQLGSQEPPFAQYRSGGGDGSGQGGSLR